MAVSALAGFNKYFCTIGKHIFLLSPEPKKPGMQFNPAMQLLL
jgi:hypothetical protein